MYPFQIGEDATVSCRRSESILFRKMARAVTSVDLPFKIQFKVAVPTAPIRLYKFLVTVALVLPFERRSSLSEVSRDDTRETKSRPNEKS